MICYIIPFKIRFERLKCLPSIDNRLLTVNLTDTHCFLLMAVKFNWLISKDIYQQK